MSLSENVKYNQRSLMLAGLLWFLLALSSCADLHQTNIIPQDTPVLAQVDSLCAADSRWVKDPSMPKDVALGQSNCQFHQFMWQSLLYLVQPIQSGSKVLQFETWMPSYGIFVEQNQQPVSWGTVPKADYCSATKPEAGYIYSNLTLQAGSHHPLLDQNLQDVFYSIAVNKQAYDFITDCDLYKAQCGLTLAPDLLTPNGMHVVDIPNKYPNLAFPDYATELKMSWKILTDKEQRSQLFYTTRGSVMSSGAQCQENVVLGLVGMHVVVKTPTHPEFIWATFEHKNNAPDCSATDEAAPLGGQWTFFDQSCTECQTNEYVKGKATQVCRMHPLGNPTQGTFPNNLNCASAPPPGYICDEDVQEYIIAPNTRNLQALNQSVTSMLLALPPSNANRLWANYQLEGNIWTLNGVLPPNLQSQRGSLASANSTMESYVQNGEANVTNPNNCLSCHNLDGKTLISSPDQASQPVLLPPAGMSHIFNLLNTNTTGCEQGTRLPTSCPVN